MYLVDTNVWLERLLAQTRAEEVGRFLDRIPSGQLFITDFAFHSIGVVLSKLNRREALFSFAEYPVASGLRSRSSYFGGVGCCGDEGEENPP